MNISMKKDFVLGKKMKRVTKKKKMMGEEVVSKKEIEVEEEIKEVEGGEEDGDEIKQENHRLQSDGSWIVSF